MKKLKLAIFGVQAKSIRQQLFSSSKKSNHGGAAADPTTATPALSQPLIQFNHADRQHEELSQPLTQSWCQKVVGGHSPLLEELIIFPEGKFTHHQLANNHVAGSTLPDGRYPTAAFNSIHPLDFLLIEAGSPLSR